MATLTAQEIERLRREIGDTGTVVLDENGDEQTIYAFQDSELNDNYDWMGGDWDKTVLKCYDQLIASTAKFNDYTQNQTQEKRSQIHANLIKTADRLQNKVDAGTRKQLKIVGAQLVPPRWKTKPGGGSEY